MRAVIEFTYNPNDFSTAMDQRELSYEYYSDVIDRQKQLLRQFIEETFSEVCEIRELIVDIEDN
jgi:hypothetical protein